MMTIHVGMLTFTHAEAAKELNRLARLADRATRLGYRDLEDALGALEDLEGADYAARMKGGQ